jgi:hypothetical protein
MHFGIDTVIQMLKNSIENKASQLYPELLSDVDLYIVDRKI